jgi:hypothetical protein
MAGEPWKVSAPFDADVARALDETRRRIFREGHYTGVEGHHFATLEELDAFFMRGPTFLRDENEEEGEGWHTLDMSGATGTQSILDIRSVGNRIAWGTAAPLDDDELREVFGTTTPMTADLTDDREDDLYEGLQRGECAYVVVYDEGKPSQIVFYGYSWD